MCTYRYVFCKHFQLRHKPTELIVLFTQFYRGDGFSKHGTYISLYFSILYNL